MKMLDAIHTFESAPSALVLVRSFSDHPCTDAEVHLIYERSEADNDRATELCLSGLKLSQLIALRKELRSMNEEYKKSYGPDYNEFVSGKDIDTMLA